MPLNRYAVPVALLLLPACATQVPVEVAEAQCVQQVLNGAGSLTVGVGVGNDGWGNDGWGGGWGTGIGGGIAVTTQLPPTQSPNQIYTACVKRKSGQSPVTPFAKRPEIAG